MSKLNLQEMTEAYVNEGTMVNSGDFNGLASTEGIKKLIEFVEKEKLLESTYQKIEVIQEDHITATKLESKSGFDISFYDCLHIAVCKRLNLVLVTRDNLMLSFAKSESLKCGKPETFL